MADEKEEKEARGSGLEERVRRDAEKAEDNRARQERLGNVAKRETEEPPPEKPKAPPRTKK